MGGRRRPAATNQVGSPTWLRGLTVRHRRRDRRDRIGAIGWLAAIRVADAQAGGCATGPTPGEADGAVISVRVWRGGSEPVSVPFALSSTDTTLIAALAGLVGAAIGGGFTLLGQLVDDHCKRRKDEQNANNEAVATALLIQDDFSALPKRR